MGPVQWGNTCWQKLPSQSNMNYQSRKLLNWQVRQLANQLWPSQREKQVKT
jgi:hypothetical protein